MSIQTAVSALEHYFQTHTQDQLLTEKARLWMQIVHALVKGDMDEYQTLYTYARSRYAPKKSHTFWDALVLVHQQLGQAFEHQTKIAEYLKVHYALI